MFLFTTYVPVQLWLLVGVTIALCVASFLLGRLSAAPDEEYPEGEFLDDVVTTPIPKSVFQALDSIVCIIGTYIDAAGKERLVHASGAVVSNGIIMTCSTLFTPLPGEALHSYRVLCTDDRSTLTFTDPVSHEGVERSRDGDKLYLYAATVSKTPLPMENLPVGWTSGPLWWIGTTSDRVCYVHAETALHATEVQGEQHRHLMAAFDTGTILGGPVLSQDGSVVGIITAASEGREVSLATPIESVDSPIVTQSPAPEFLN